MVSGWVQVSHTKREYPEVYMFPTPDHLRVNDFPSAITIDSGSFAKAFKKAYPKTPLARANGGYVLVIGPFSAYELGKPGSLGLGELVEVSSIRSLILGPRDK